MRHFAAMLALLIADAGPDVSGSAVFDIDASNSIDPSGIVVTAPSRTLRAAASESGSSVSRSRTTSRSTALTPFTTRFGLPRSSATSRQAALMSLFADVESVPGSRLAGASRAYWPWLPRRTPFDSQLRPSRSACSCSRQPVAIGSRCRLGMADDGVAPDANRTHDLALRVPTRLPGLRQIGPPVSDRASSRARASRAARGTGQLRRRSSIESIRGQLRRAAGR